MYSIDELLGDIERLRKVQATTPAEVASWYERAQSIQDRIKRTPALADSLPHCIWHYFSDADIRAADAQYRELQEVELSKAIAELSMRGRA